MRSSASTLLAVISTLASPAIASPPIDLSGEWRFATDESDSRLASSPVQWHFPEKIHLPGHIAAQGFGEKPSIRTK